MKLLVYILLAFSVAPGAGFLVARPAPPQRVQPPLFATTNNQESLSIQKQLAKSVAGGLALLALSFPPVAHLDTPMVPVANAAGTSRVVGTLKGSGLVFKDTLQIEAFDDPKVNGVKLYISNFQIPVTERLSGKNLFSDPTQASVACARSSKVSIADNIAKGPAGEEVFEESKSLLFKSLRVQRIYDEEANTMIYVSFNTRLDKSDDSNKSRFKSSLCAINLD